MLGIAPNLFILLTEVEFTSIRAQGAGGQHVNKVASAIHLRFNIQQSSLPDEHKERLLQTRDYRVSAEGIVVIKAQRYKSQEKNKADALDRLIKLIQGAIHVPKKRKKTKPSKQSVRRRLDSKTLRGHLKKLRHAQE